MIPTILIIIPSFICGVLNCENTCKEDNIYIAVADIIILSGGMAVRVPVCSRTII